MKIYFDNVDDLDFPNCKSLSKNACIDFWLTAPGTRLKRELKQLGIPFFKIDYMTDPGLYFIDVNGDPIWWTGLAQDRNGPPHILNSIPINIIKLVRKKKLRLIISADREGGGMIFDGRDGFLATMNAMKERDLPAGSVLILQGNSKVEKQYEDWLLHTNNEKLFEIKYSNHFDKIFINDDLPSSPIILESLKIKSSKSFNSLNRTYKSHRSSHIYMLTVSDMLNKGIVSFNETRFQDQTPLELVGIINSKTPNVVKNQLVVDYDNVIKKNYPLFVDGDWSVKNAANFVNTDIFKNSLISFVTETKFDEDVIFLTEKVFKCLAYGHPMILLGPCGTLKELEKLGYITNWCGLNSGYNDIEDHVERFHATHNTLQTWVNFPTNRKIKEIENCMPVIQHNFDLSAKRNLYHESLIELINNSKEYFNERF